MDFQYVSFAVVASLMLFPLSIVVAWIICVCNYYRGFGRRNGRK